MKVQIYEWLYSHDGSYIRIKKDIKEAEFVAKSVSLVTGQSSVPSTAYLTSDALRQLLCYKYASGYSLNWYYASGIVKLFEGDYNNEHKYKINTDGLYIDDAFMSDWSFTSTQPSFIGSTTTIFDAQDIRQGNVSGLKYFKTDSLYLRPCKLLASYGSHPAGECAMIDVLSNTLYFNHGSGAFSVEGEAGEIIDTTPVVNNIISPMSTKAVRLREWLVNDESSYINTNIPLKDLQSLKMPVVIPTKALNEAHIFGTLPQGWAGLNNFRCYKSITRDILILMYENDNGNSYEGIHNVIVPITYNKEIEIKYLDHNNGTALAKIGDTDKVISIPTNPTSTAPIVLFCCGQINWRFVGLKIGKVEINDTILHPAELVLPYKNHPIGECCMIDLNSGDLYFNECSGQFTCEGAVLSYWQDKPMVEHYCDVEGTLHRSVQIFADNGKRLRLIWEKNLPFTTHRWLKGDGIAYINTNFLPKATSDISATFKIINNIAGVVDVFGQRQSSLYSDQTRTRVFIDVNILSFGLGDMNTDAYKTPINIGETYNVELNNKVLLNGNVVVPTLRSEREDATFPIYLFALNDKGTCSYVKNGLSISNFASDNLHLVPAVLNRNILPSEDANGKARQKGEAVMIDANKYKIGKPFVYGNIANSGSFKIDDSLIRNEDFEIIGGVKSDGLQYIDTLQIINETKTDLVIGYADITPNTYSSTEKNYSYLCGTRNVNISNSYVEQAQIVFSQKLELRNNYSGQFGIEGQFLTYAKVPARCVIRTDWKNNVTYYNDVAYENGKLLSDVSQKYSFVIFTTRTAEGRVINRIKSSTASLIGSITEFSLTDVASGKKLLDLIPVRLKKAIEPTCTHNGKGGSEGEYCFFDTISGRAFVNDGSGKFRRYFEEGVDYERVAGVSMINASLSLNIALSDVPMQLEYYYSAQDDGGYFNTRKGVSKSIPYQLYNSASHELTLRDREQEHSYLPPTADILSASLTTDSVIVNGQTYNLMAGVFEGININANGSVNVRVIKQNGVIDLIPIRLLKKAYASDTHNGREYSSGTICFYDQVSGHIFGNDGQGEFSEYIPE